MNEKERESLGVVFIFTSSWCVREDMFTHTGTNGFVPCFQGF